MEENTVVNPSSENAGTPQNAPAGVFVPNGQTPVESVVPVQETPVQQSVSQVVETPVTQQIEQTSPAEVKKEGALDKFFTWVAKFIAKVSWQPDPITGEQNSVSQALQKSQNIVGKVRGVANQVVDKASDVANKTTTAVTQATEKIQNVIPAPTAAPSTEQAVVESVGDKPEQAVVTPSAEQTVVDKPEQVVAIPSTEQVVAEPVADKLEQSLDTKPEQAKK